MRGCINSNSRMIVLTRITYQSHYLLSCKTFCEDTLVVHLTGKMTVSRLS